MPGVAKNFQGGIAHTKDHTVAKFTLYLLNDGSLNGTAHISFTEHYQYASGVSTVPCKEDWTVTPSWEAKLGGTVRKQSDGSIAVAFKASPSNGPAYPAEYCDRPLSVTPYWGGTGGTLVNGRFHDQKVYNTSNGTTTVTTHLEMER